MRQIALLLVAATLVTSTTGCGIFRRMKDRFCRGSLCGSVSAPAPTYAVPTPVVVPQAAVMAAPANCYPCDPCAEQCVGYGSYMDADCGCAAPADYSGAGTITTPIPATSPSTFPGPTN